MKFAGNRLAFSALTALVAVTAGLAPVYGQNSKPGNDPSEATIPASIAGGKSFKQPYGSHLEPILVKIAATPDQRKNITAVFLSYKPKLQPLRDQYNVKRDEFLKSLCDGKDAAVVMSQQVELGRLYSDITSQYTFMRLDIRRYLSPNQIVLFEQYRKQQGWNR